MIWKLSRASAGKRMRAALLAAVMLAGCVLPGVGAAAAQTYVYEAFFTAERIEQAPVIDGVFDEDYWDVFTPCLKGSGTQETRFDMKWDDKNLYIALSVTGVSELTPGTDNWGEIGDEISFYFNPTVDYLGDIQLEDMSYEEAVKHSEEIGYLQLGVGYQEDGQPNYKLGTYRPALSFQNAVTNSANTRAACKATADGWDLEIAFRLEDLQISGVQGGAFGFEIQASTGESDGSNIWAASNGITSIWNNTKGFGKVTLGSPAAELRAKTASGTGIMHSNIDKSQFSFEIEDAEGNVRTVDGNCLELGVESSDSSVIEVQGRDLVAKKAGSADLTFRYKNSDLTARIPVSVEAKAIITIDSVAEQVTYPGYPLRFVLSASSTLENPIVYAMTETPEGVSTAVFDAESRSFNWTPEEADIGVNEFVFTASDSTGGGDQITVAVTVKPEPEMVFNDIPDKTVALGESLNFMVQVTSNSEYPITYSLVKDETTPKGVWFSSEKQRLVWEPAAEDLGETTLTFSATDGIKSVTKDVKIQVVSAQTQALSFPAIAKKTVTAGKSLSFEIKARTTLPDAVIAYEAVSLPAGARYDTETQVFSWDTQDTDVGAHTVKIRARAEDLTAETTVSIQVNAQSSGGNSAGGGSYGGSGGGSGYTGTPTIGSGQATTQASSKFDDMAGYGWAADAVDTLADYGIVKGTGERSFSPGAQVTRADFIVLMVRALKLTAEPADNFADVAESDYYSKDVAIAKALGVADGVGGGRFDPRAPITRQDMMVIAARAVRAAGYTLNGDSKVLAGFSDREQLAEYAEASAAAMVAGGLVGGADGALKPLGLTTRAECAVIVHRLILKYGY